MNLIEYQHGVEKTWIKNEYDLTRIVLGIGGESGEILECFKKMYRGDYENEKSSILAEKIEKEIGDLSYYIAKLCNYLGYSWEEVLKNNLEKLDKRQKTGKLQGEGSER